MFKLEGLLFGEKVICYAETREEANKMAKTKGYENVIVSKIGGITLDE